MRRGNDRNLAPLPEVQIPCLETIPLDHEDLEGKSFFGASSDGEGDILCVPFHGHALVVTAGKRARPLPGAGSSGCKWLGIAKGANGSLYAAPFNSDSILEISSVEGRKKRFGATSSVIEDRKTDFIAGVGKALCKYSGATAGLDGNIYCSPFNADTVLVIRPEKRDFVKLEGASGGKSKWAGAATGPDGKIYCAPYDAESVLVVDVETQQISFIHGVIGGRGKWFGAVAGPDGRIYCAPHNADAVLVVNPEDQSFSYIGGVGGTTGKWSGGAVGADGAIYFAPYNAESVLIVTPETGALTFLEGAGSRLGKYFGAATSVDGRILCAPYNAKSILVIRTLKEVRAERRRR